MWSGYLSNCFTNTEVCIWESQTTHVCNTIICKDRYLTGWPSVVVVVISGRMLWRKFIGNPCILQVNTTEHLWRQVNIDSDNGLVPVELVVQLNLKIYINIQLALCEGSPSVTGGFLTQSTSNAEIISMAWRLNDAIYIRMIKTELKSQWLIWRASILNLFIHPLARSGCTLIACIFVYSLTKKTTAVFFIHPAIYHYSYASRFYHRSMQMIFIQHNTQTSTISTGNS